MTHLAAPSRRQVACRTSVLDPFLAGLAGGSLAGAIIGLLTLRLNPELAEHLGDRHLVLLYGALLYGALGALSGLLAGVASGLLGVVLRLAWARPLARTVTAACGLVPLLLAAMLPDVGIVHRLLADLVFAGNVWRWIVGICGLLLAVLLGSRLLEDARRRVPEALGAPRRFYAAAWGLGMGALALAAGLLSPAPIAGPVARAASEASQIQPSAPAKLPRRVVLLCIDGLDPTVLERLLERGELPTFGRFVAEGSWGPLATLEPTLSAVVWTSIATGKSKSAHGIYHFLHSELPGLSAPILEFPLLTGLNFRILAQLERIPGMPRLQRYFTTQQRRSDALWNLVGRSYRVGVWQWLISWPAETVPGFYVSGGVGWAQFGGDGGAGSGEQRSFHPADLFEGIELAGRTPASRTFEVAGLQIGPGDRRWRPVAGLLGNRVNELLPALIDKYDPRFVAAAFYNLDVFQHFFGRSEGPEEQIVPAAYRFVDARLGELVSALGDDTEVIVVSDHGFDFAHGHHTFAPPGVFLARGPAFAAGRRVEGLGVLDIAPLVLRLLDLPLGEDMPGTSAGRYSKGLTDAFLRSHPERRIATWERRSEAAGDAGEMPLDEELREVLKSLGYI